MDFAKGLSIREHTFYACIDHLDKKRHLNKKKEKVHKVKTSSTLSLASSRRLPGLSPRNGRHRPVQDDGGRLPQPSRDHCARLPRFIRPAPLPVVQTVPGPPARQPADCVRRQEPRHQLLQQRLPRARPGLQGLGAVAGGVAQRWTRLVRILLQSELGSRGDRRAQDGQQSRGLGTQDHGRKRFR